MTRTERKPGRNPDRPMSDRERILFTLVRQLGSTMLMTGAGRQDYTAIGGGEYTHFVWWDKPKAGDLVLAQTGHVNEWTVGFYVEPLPSHMGGAVIREIGTERLCNYANESFWPIRGMSEIDLLEGDRRVMYAKVRKAFALGDEYMYRFGGIVFDGQNVTVTVREAFGGFDQSSEPFKVTFAWTPRMAVKRVLEQLRAGGYGTRSFRQTEVAA